MEAVPSVDPMVGARTALTPKIGRAPSVMLDKTAG
jgi:hypothetical protein